MIISETQAPPVGGMGGSVHSWERGLDPWHKDAAPTQLSDAFDGGDRKGGWTALDAFGNAIGFIADGETYNEHPRPTTVDPDDIIVIKPSPTADTRSCDWSKVSQEQLCDSSVQHREDVRKGFEFFKRIIDRQVQLHDHDKLSDIESFHADFKTGFEQHEWWDRHRKINRHHLMQEDGVPEDVNLIDVLDLIVDCTMAGLARTGELYPIVISDDVLKKAFANTCWLLVHHVRVERANG